VRRSALEEKLPERVASPRPDGYSLRRVGISPYLRQLRESVGHELLLVPSVAVLVWDADGRLLLVREAETGRWQTVGGAIDPDESPREAATRETLEETGLSVGLDGIRDVLGGPQFRLRYRNGDLVSYVPTVFDAHVLAGTPRPDGEEVLEVAWFAERALACAPLTEFTHSLFETLLPRTGG
jgi:8-oxo-dGTP pyrophosphatase MutT (NUDIX family)